MSRWIKVGFRAMFRFSGLKPKKDKKERFGTLSKLAAVAFSGKYLVYTNVTVASVLSAFGDIIEQKYERTEKLDLTRTKHMALTGTAVGFVNHFWYHLLDGVYPGCSLRSISAKIFLDQLVGVPVDLVVFFGTFALLKGMNWEEFKGYMGSKVWKLYLVEMLIWPSAQFVNFYFLPRKYRVLYDNFVCLGYDVFISRLANKRNKEAKKNDK